MTIINFADSSGSPEWRYHISTQRLKKNLNLCPDINIKI